MDVYGQGAFTAPGLPHPQSNIILFLAVRRIYLVSSPEYADEQAYLNRYREYADKVVEVTQDPS